MCACLCVCVRGVMQPYFPHDKYVCRLFLGYDALSDSKNYVVKFNTRVLHYYGLRSAYHLVLVSSDRFFLNNKNTICIPITVKPLILASIIFSDFTTNDILASIN